MKFPFIRSNHIIENNFNPSERQYWTAPVVCIIAPKMLLVRRRTYRRLVMQSQLLEIIFVISLFETLYYQFYDMWTLLWLSKT
ncbi:hypothetical protein F5Y05DRAFT_372084 [Hypoxylon sp. FL0543]|nr:hypothetical protein F5Y05DRAFT_372084 [Hypoxylon sp. FL0543]